MRKILVAIDSFKGSMSSLEAGYGAKEGIRRAEKELREKEGIPVEIVVKPVADGGEGTTEAVISGLGGEIVYVDAANPLGQKVRAKYGIVKDKKLAVLEMAEAAGITLLDKKDLNPSLATTYGVGEIIRDAIKRGCREFIVGIGGSATTDGGAGMLQALGFELLDEKGEELPWGIQALDKLMDIRDEKVPEELKECHFTVACDVKNPLLGLEGAVYIYGEQKGIKREEKPEFEKKMTCYAERTVKFTGREVRQTPGAGAAGAAHTGAAAAGTGEALPRMTCSRLAWAQITTPEATSRSSFCCIML